MKYGSTTQWLVESITFQIIKFSLEFCTCDASCYKTKISTAFPNRVTLFMHFGLQVNLHIIKYTSTAIGIIILYVPCHLLTRINKLQEDQRPTLFCRLVTGYLCIILANGSVLLGYYLSKYIKIAYDIWKYVLLLSAWYFRFYDSQLIQQPCVNLRLTLIFHGYFAPLRLLKFNGV